MENDHGCSKSPTHIGSSHWLQELTQVPSGTGKAVVIEFLVLFLSIFLLWAFLGTETFVSFNLFQLMFFSAFFGVCSWRAHDESLSIQLWSVPALIDCLNGTAFNACWHRIVTRCPQNMWRSEAMSHLLFRLPSPSIPPFFWLCHCHRIYMDLAMLVSFFGVGWTTFLFEL